MPAPAAADAFTLAAEPFRRELLAHCYRMLGSVTDAQDAVQETMLRGWRAHGRYDPARASMRTWLYRIATNVCLTALEGRRRRPLPSGVGHPSDDPGGPAVPGLDVSWLEPLPDRMLTRGPDDPSEATVERAGLRLALVSAVQLLPPRQRAVLLLREVLGFSAVEVATVLDTTVAAVNSAGQRGRARLAGLDLHAETRRDPDPAEQELVDRYAEALERADVAGLVRLLSDDTVLEMPPMRRWFVGREAHGAFITDVFERRGIDWRTVATGANGQPALGAYRRVGDHFELHVVQVFSARRGVLDRTTAFQDPEVLALFDLPELLPVDRRDESEPSRR